MSTILADESATQIFAKGLLSDLAPGMIIYLQGILGAGKTTLVRSLLRATGFTGIVKSPSYTLVETYELDDFVLHHFDLYRLADPEELEYLGLMDYLTDNSICIFEWPELGKGQLPKADLSIKIDIVPQGRRFEVIRT